MSRFERIRKANGADDRSGSIFRRHPWAWAIGGLVTLLVVCGVGLLIWLRSDSANPVDVADIVDRYRAQAATSSSSTTTSSTVANDRIPHDSQPADRTDSTSSPAGAAPVTPGVYVYDTTGSESVDALGGSRHRYPATTTITVTREGDRCIRMRWDALEQRWDDRVLCRDGATWRIVALTTFHSFFRQDENRSFTCDDDALFVPDATAGKATPGSSYRCASRGSGKSGASYEIDDVSVVGHERVDVGGAEVDAVHVHYDVTVGGETTGATSIDRWFATDVPGLLVRETNEGWTRSDTVIGAVEYDETYDLRLRRLEPLA